MSALRLLRPLCVSVAMLWLAAYFAYSAREHATSAEALVELSRIALPLEPPAAPESKPQADSIPERSPHDAVANVGSDELAVGERLLAANGSFPVLSAGYDDFRSFRSYARAMHALGARFVVIRDREIVGAADLERGRLEATGSLAGFSPRARNYTGEPALSALTRHARERYGEGAVIRMLVPRKLDAGLFGGIERQLADRGDAYDRYTELRGRYLPAPDGSARFRVESALRTDGTEVALELLFDLGQIAGAEADREPRA